MGFKKVKINEKSLAQRLIPFITSGLSVIIVFVLGLSLLEATKQLNFNLFDFLGEKITHISSEGSEKNKINILLVGRGGGNHDAPNLTDTIILGSIDTKKNITSLFSIPRDLYVDIDENRTGKINELYSRALNQNKNDEKIAMNSLRQKIEEITGENIDYYVNIDFEGFKEIVDLFDGVDVTVEENLVDYEYPNGRGGYTTFVLRKGTWTLDGETALKYARSRHSTSDFDRSLRQQQLISALKKKITEKGFFSSAGKIKELYEITNKYMSTDMDIKTMVGIALKVKENNEILSFNLNNSCVYGAVCTKGGLLYTPDRYLFGGASVVLPEGATASNLGEYSEIQKFTNLVFNYRSLYKEDYLITIFNSTKTPNLAKDIATSLTKFGFNLPSYNAIGNTKGELYEETTILYNNIDKNSETLRALEYFLNVPLQKVEKPLYSNDENTKIEIVLGSDYLQLENNF
ncbi:LCP family protein [Candidatus Gracilibacteria bacterium]|nr:LCP family protein [Candidatus Gracilibacteria bacterium]NUJ99098.1 LCP family protein [Candidatus Gracilibacteria bacterium]